MSLSSSTIILYKKKEKPKTREKANKIKIKGQKKEEGFGNTINIVSFISNKSFLFLKKKLLNNQWIA